jgi:hypothetical protein
VSKHFQLELFNFTRSLIMLSNRSKTYKSRISSFLARNVYPQLIAWKPSQRKYQATISGLLPEALQKPEDKEKLNSLLKKWSDSSDDDIQTISKLIRDAIKLSNWFALKAALTLGGLFLTIYLVYFLLQPKIPKESQCLIDEDCLLIAPGATVKDVDSDNLDNSKLSIRIVQDANGDERLGIHHDGNRLENVCVMGNRIVYQGVVIARFTKAGGDSPLIINFKVEPPTKTRNNTDLTTGTDANNPPISNVSEDKIPGENSCVTDGTGGIFPITTEIVQKVLNNITYQNSKSFKVGERTLEIKLTDGDGGSQETRYISIALVQKPRPVTIKVPGSQVVKENSRLGINGINITNVNFSKNQNITVTLEVNYGKLTINDQVVQKLKADAPNNDKSIPKIDANKTKKVTLTGTIDSINAVFGESNAVTYQGDQNFTEGDDNLIVGIDDGSSPTVENHDLVYPPKAQFGKTKGEIVIRVKAKNAPSIFNSSDDIKTVAEDTPLPISGLKIQDPDSKMIVVNFRANNGIITVSGESGGSKSAQVSDSGSPNVTLQGSIDQINDKLAKDIVYRGNSEFSGDDSLIITASDERYNDKKTINIKVNSINDPPIVDITNVADSTPPPLSDGSSPQPPNPTPSPASYSGSTNATNATITGEPGYKNIRSGPDDEYPRRHIAYPGDRVWVIETKRNSDNFLWYHIYFPRSRADGWIAGNLLTVDSQQTSPP